MTKLSQKKKKGGLNLDSETTPHDTIFKANLDTEKSDSGQQENIEKCTDNLVTKNRKISDKKARKLCSMLNGVLNTPNERDIPEKFDNILHKWFMDTSIIEEIFKTLRSEQLCFLHEIFHIVGFTKFLISTHRGRDQFNLSIIDTLKYYNDQIVPCDSKLIAIPLNIFWPKENFAHAIIVIIDRTGFKEGKKHIIIEYFDSSTITSYFNIEKKIKNLIIELFGTDGYTYEFIGQMEVCPDNIQERLSETEYSGSCSQFQLWYAFKRLLEPDKPREQVIKEMNEFLNNGEAGMIELIKTFQSLVDINLFDSDENIFSGTVNGRNFVSSYQTAGNKRTKRRFRKCR